MKIVFAGDYHIHNYPQHAHPWKEGLNTRVRDILQTLYLIPKVIEKEKADLFCSLGDWHFNASNDYRVESAARGFAQACIKAVKANGGAAIGIHGNHDTVSSDENLHNNFHYIPNTIAGHTTYKELSIYCIGYNTKLPEISQIQQGAAFTLFLLHKDIAGGKTSEGFIYKTDGSVPQSYFTEVYKRLSGKVLFINGHYHSPHTAGKVICCGSPVQFNRGDRLDKRGVYVFDTNTKKGNWLFLKGPKFFDVPWPIPDRLVDFTDPKVYLNILAKTDAEYREAYDFKKANAAGSCSIQVIMSKAAVTVSSSSQSTSAVGNLMSDDELMVKYLMEKEGLNKNTAIRLVKKSKAFLDGGIK